MQWIDDHREVVILLIVLPLGWIMTRWNRTKSLLTAPRPSLHNRRVERVCRDIRSGTTSGKPMRTDRKGTETLETRVSDKSGATKIKVRDLRRILSVDREGSTVRVEPYATMGDVVDWLDRRGLELETAIEMKGATLGGLVLAIGMTTHSHISGLMHDIVTAYDLVTAEGQHVHVTEEGEHSDLFRALPFSHGTLGILVALELKIRKSPAFVELVYRPFFDFDEFTDEHTRLLNSENPPFYLEGQIFGRDRAVIIEGYPSDKKNLPVNRINRWHKPFFFKHAESMLDLPRGTEYRELVPNRDFLMRHERSMCMTLGQILPTANRWWFRWFFGWLLPPNLPLMKSSRPEEERIRSMKEQVYQDFAFPADKLKTLLNHLHREFEIYPLLLYPCKVIDRGGLIRLPGGKGKEWTGTSDSALYLNLGVYGYPKAVREGDREYPTIEKVREVESMINSSGGFLHTYVDVFTTEEEFESMFDHTLWKRMRVKYKAEGAFPSIYDKIKPEINPFDLH